jgi:hypothetical protein
MELARTRPAVPPPNRWEPLLSIVEDDTVPPGHARVVYRDGCEAVVDAEAIDLFNLDGAARDG